MKPVKFTPKDTRKVDLGTKTIYKYPAPSKLLELNHMKLNGRHPEKKDEFILEHDCQFIVYVIKGKGKIYAGDEVFEVRVGDAVYVPTETRFAAEGKGFEYITAETPAWYPEQAEIISIKKK